MMNNMTRPRWMVAVLLVAMGPGAVLSALGAAPWHKLSGAMPPNGDVVGLEISPDSKYVVYAADQEVDELHNLFSVPLDGGSPMRLSDLSGAGGEPAYVESYAISPDGSRVVLVGEQDEAGRAELYSVPIMGPASAAVKLNKTLPEDGDVWAFSISPDSKTVVYSADQDKDKTNELYAVPIAGPASAGVKLNGPVVGGGSLYAFAISPDSKTVVYRGDQDAYDVAELYSVPINGAAAPVKLSKIQPGGGDVGGFRIDPTSQLVVYEADQETYGKVELHAVPIKGPAGNGKKISPASMAYGVWSFEISANGQRVVYEARQDTISKLELYSVPILGPAASVVKLNIALEPGRGIFTYKLSPDGSHVLYCADRDAEYEYDLFSVPIAGPASANVKLNRALAPDGGVNRFDISPDSTRVVYTAEQQGSPTNELYSVPIAGPATAGVKLNGPLVNGGKAWTFEISPDGTQVLYLADANTVAVDEVFAVPIAGPASAGGKISGPMAAGGSGAGDIWHSPDSQHFIYTAQQDSATSSELYAVGADGPPDNQTRYLPVVVRGG